MVAHISIRAAALAAFFMAEASAQDAQTPSTTPEPTGVWSLTSENDLFGGTDRNYSNGLRIERVRPANRITPGLNWVANRIPLLDLDPALGVRFVFPHAPAIPVTLNGGLRMPAWYDIRSGDLRTRHDLDGLRRSARQVEALLDREQARGVAPGGDVGVLERFGHGGSLSRFGVWCLEVLKVCCLECRRGAVVQSSVAQASVSSSGSGGGFTSSTGWQSRPEASRSRVS